MAIVDDQTTSEVYRHLYPVEYSGDDYNDWVKTNLSEGTGSTETTGGSTVGESNLVGSTQSGSGAYGVVPEVPNPVGTAGTAISGNIGNLSGIYSLGSGLNTFNAQQALNQYINNLPGYEGMVGQSSENILSNLQGKISDDVVSNLWQYGGERGISTGLGGGSANYNTALMKALGTNSMALQQLGETQLTNAVQRTPTSQLFNTSSMLVTPEQQQEAQMYANYYKSMPNPTEAAAAEEAATQRGLRTGISAGTGRTGGGTTGTTGSGTLGGGTGGRGMQVDQPTQTGQTGRRGTGTGTLTMEEAAAMTDQELEDYVMSLPYTGDAPVTEDEWADWLDNLPSETDLADTGAESSGDWLTDLLYGYGEFADTEGGWAGTLEGGDQYVSADTDYGYEDYGYDNYDYSGDYSDYGDYGDWYDYYEY